MNKGLEALKRIKDFMEINAKHWKQDVGYIEKELKALEIIKDKRVDVDYLIKSNDLHDYNNFIVPHGFKTLTQEEYDLLKEVLL